MTQDESQEPIGYWDGFFDATDKAIITKFKRVHNSQNAPLYTHPPQCKPLTDEQIEAFTKAINQLKRSAKVIQSLCPQGYIHPELGSIHRAIADAQDALAHPPQRTEQNFCSRCGKRIKDLTNIHTCTPPQD